MLDGGYIHPRNEHTKPAGIWRKLQSLYNLGSLDEREDSRQLEKVEIPDEFRKGVTGSDEASSSTSGDADAYSEAANKIGNEDFDLPGEEFAEMKWTQRLASDKQRKDESPPILPELNLADEPPVRFTPTFSIEPSEVATPSSRKGRVRAGTTGTKGRAAPVAAPAARTRLSRQAESVANDGEEQSDEDEEEGEEEEKEESQEEAEESQEEAEESQDSTPAPRSTRSTRALRGRTAARSRARGRGRGR